MAKKYLYDKESGKSLLVTPDNMERIKQAYMANKDKYELQIEDEGGAPTQYPPSADAQELRRQVFNPTPQEVANMPVDEKAAYISKKRGIPYNEAYGLVAALPRSADLYSQDQEPSLLQVAQEGGKDLISQQGRAMASAVGGKPFLEGMAEIEGEGFWDKLYRDPMTPISVGAGMGAGFGVEQVGLSGLGKIGALGLLEGGAVTGAKQALGEDQTLGDLAFEVGTGMGGEALGQGLKIATPAIRKGIRRMSADQAGAGITEEALEFASGAPWKKLESWDQLRSSAGTQDDIAKDLVLKLNDFENYMLESPTIFKALKSMPEVSIDPAIKVLKDARITPKGGRPLDNWEIDLNDFIDKKISRYTSKNPELDNLIALKKKALSDFDSYKPAGGIKMADKFKIAEQKKALSADLDAKIANAKANPKINLSAEGVYDLRKAVDANVDFGRGKDSATKKANAAMMKVRTALKNSLEAAATKSGNPEYIKSMKTLSSKLQARDNLLPFLGKSEQTQSARAESFINNLYGKNKSERQRLLKNFDVLFGSDIAKRSKTASFAKQFDEGTPPIFPVGTTGRYGPLKALGTLGIASPMATTRVIDPSLKALGDITSRIPVGAGSATGSRLGELYEVADEQ